MRLALLVVCGLCASVAWSQNPHDRHAFNRAALLQNADIPAVLRTAIRNGPSLRFVGTRVVQGGRNSSHEEIVYREGDKSRTEFPDGSKNAGQIIVEDGHDRKHYFPERNELVLDSPRREEAFQRLLRMANRGAQKRLVLTPAQGQQVAGLATEQVVVSDASGNVVQRLFIEPRSGALLKRQIFGAGGAQDAYFEFTQINLNPRPFDPALFKFERKGVKVITPYDTLRRVASKNGFDAVALPRSSGYRLEGSHMREIDNEKVLVELYGAKQIKLTLFELTSAVSQERLAQFTRGDLHGTTWVLGGKTYVLLGPLDVPSLTRLSQMATLGTR